MIGAVPFGALSNGREIQLYTLSNRRGMEARIMTYGGIVTSLTAPDRDGRYADVVLGFDSLSEYIEDNSYVGAVIGRYANRIAQGRFTLGGVDYSLPVNNPPNSSHGGIVGFDKVVWEVRSTRLTPQGSELTLHYVSPDGDQGFPGNLSVTAVYTLTGDNALRLDYTATTDKDTVVNLSQHTYFNLRGLGDILEHVVHINADRFTPVDEALIPTGQLRSVWGTPFDFREATAIGARIDAKDEQLALGKGYDHNWVLREKPYTLANDEALRVDATVYEPETGRVLKVFSTQPGLQFYSGNLLDGTLTGKRGRVYERRSGFCLEPQHYPDSPNHRNFPSTTLMPGQVYKNTIVYGFSAR